VHIVYADPDDAVLAHLTLRDHGIASALTLWPPESGDPALVEVASVDVATATDVLDRHGLAGDVDRPIL
jgi:hypothetical protein